MTSEIYRAAERLFHAAGCKPKDITQIVAAKLQSDHQIEFAVVGGLLQMAQNGAPVSAGQVIAAFRERNPRMFYGEAGAVNFRSDLQGDPAAMSRWIKEHSLAEWEALPASPNSPGAHRVVRDVIPSEAMTKEEYTHLSTQEKSALIAEIGADGIGRILARR